MPKIVSEEERKLTQEAIYEKTLRLIKDKGIQTVTVDDIVTAVGIGKGTFYTYYPSKETCLYEVLKRCEREDFSRMEKMLSSGNVRRQFLLYSIIINRSETKV